MKMQTTSYAKPLRVLCNKLFMLAAGMMLVLSTSLAIAEEPIHGIVMVAKGDIKVTNAQSKQSETAKVGKKVFPGDTITAGPDSRAKIVMSDKNVLNISPDTKVIIEKYSNDGKDKNVELKVEYGKIRAAVEQKYDGENSKFNVKTPSAVAGVRGTDFLTSYDRGSKQSQIVTFSGTVAVGKPGPGGAILNPVFVQPGQMTTSAEGKAPEAPKVMPKEEMKKMNQESQADSGATAKNQPAAGTPAKEEKKEEKKDDKPEQQASKDAPPSKDAKESKDAKKSEGERGPASAETGSKGPSMVDSKDLGPEMSKDVQIRSPGSAGAPPPNFNPGSAPMMNQPPPNTFINDAVKNMGSKTSITIIKQ